MPEFPKHFLWGAATSAHQVEGNNRNNDWWQWEQQSGHIADGTVSGDCCDHYHRFRDDFTLARELGQNAHRLSLEWSRIEPRPGVFDQKELDHYQHVLEDLKKQEFTVMVTLHHFTNPLWLTQKGGWENPKAVDHFLAYSRRVVAEFKNMVDFWITFNEPMVYIGASYLAGYWPPQKKNLTAALRVFRHLIRAHRKTYALIHSLVPATRVSIAKNNIFFEAGKNNFLQRLAVSLLAFLWNHAFLKLIRGQLDFIGLNYYFRALLSLNRESRKNLKPLFVARIETRHSNNAIVLENNPLQMYDVIMDLARYRLPIYITEHGVADSDDHVRPWVIKEGLRSVARALRRGVDVRGYFHWSLLDNFEWAEGRSLRFGLIAVDYTTQKRTVRPSALFYCEVCKNNRF